MEVKRTIKADVVLDPFAGSGTFGRVAKIMNRIPIMCEMNEKYFNIAKERIDSIVDEVEE